MNQCHCFLAGKQEYVRVFEDTWFDAKQVEKSIWWINVCEIKNGHSKLSSRRLDHDHEERLLFTMAFLARSSGQHYLSSLFNNLRNSILFLLFFFSIDHMYLKIWICLQDFEMWIEFCWHPFLVQLRRGQNS